jgi:site-specific DNA recombinase
MTEETTEEKKLRVALYIRVSTAEQTEKFGIPLQKDALVSLVKSKPTSMELAGEDYIYIDDVSGTTPLDKRPAFTQLQEDIVLAPEGQKPFDIVAVYRIDRFARKLKILYDIIEFFEQKDIKFISANESIDTSTPFGKAMLGIIGVIAELERETILQRTQLGRAQAFETGIPMGRNVSFGYIKGPDKKHQIDSEEANIVKMIFNMFINEKKSSNQIAKYLTDIGISSPEASSIIKKKRKGNMVKQNPINFWRSDRVISILKDEIYIGNLYGNKTKGNKPIPRSEWKLSATSVPSIVDGMTFIKAQTLLNQNKHQKSETKSGHIYLLSGLLKCDCCYDPTIDPHGPVTWTGERKEIKKGSENFTYLYRCGRKNIAKNVRKCFTLPLPAEEIENYLIDFIKKLLQNPSIIVKYQRELKSHTQNIEIIKQKEVLFIRKIEEVVSQRVRLKELYIATEIPWNDYAERKEKMNKQEERYQQELSKIRFQIAKNSIDESQIEALEAISRRYEKGLDDIFSNREETYTLFHELIEEIIVYSRQVEKTDTIAGRKKDNQQIPQTLNISLKLPPDLMKELTLLSPVSKLNFNPRDHIFYKNAKIDQPPRDKDGNMIISSESKTIGGAG